MAHAGEGRGSGRLRWAHCCRIMLLTLPGHLWTFSSLTSTGLTNSMEPLAPARGRGARARARAGARAGGRAGRGRGAPARAGRAGRGAARRGAAREGRRGAAGGRAGRAAARRRARRRAHPGARPCHTDDAAALRAWHPAAPRGRMHGFGLSSLSSLIACAKNMPADACAALSTACRTPRTVGTDSGGGRGARVCRGGRGGGRARARQE